jgi:CheY-like chemotaxis protein
MKGMNGLELTARIKRDCPDIKVLIHSCPKQNMTLGHPKV